MKKELEFDKSKKVFPIIIAAIGFILMVAVLIVRLNLAALVNVIFCCVVCALILIGLIFKKKLYLGFIVGYSESLLGILLYFIFFGADAGFGAFTSGLAGFNTAAHPLLTGEGSILTRLLGNILLALPTVTALVLLTLTVVYLSKKVTLQKVLSGILSLVLVLTTIMFVLTMNLRSKPNVERMWDGQDDYLKKVDKKTKDNKSPNILFIMMDDLGYGDISANGAIYDTPNIDRIAREGTQFTNFYSSYSVCSPSRFAALTGRYPYRGCADNVMYPTVSTFKPFAATRLFNSVEMGCNADGMLGDEITIAEVLKSAGYNTGCFGKWHLGDYGEYLPTNQGFDYFYGSHHVNDMTPFYHAKEENGEYEIVHGTDELKDQKNATKWIYEEINSWITDKVKNSDEPFFAYYATPWPHAPVFVGDEFKGKTGMGTYVDCVTEFDYYLGKLFDTLEDLDVMDDTIIVFTSDNGPALEGSVKDLRGGKYLAYDGGQKVPFLIRWENNDGLFKAGSTYDEAATLVDLFPTLIDMCDITVDGKENVLPFDRTIDGVSMMPILKNDEIIHTKEHPILHMKREDLKAIQYAIPTKEILAKDEYKDYNFEVLKNNEYLVFKYFDKIQNDNSAFFDKYRKNWLHILTDDKGENYNRSIVYPTIADEMHKELDRIQKDFKENRRGIVEQK